MAGGSSFISWRGEQENAFALPGRHIVLVSGLLKRAKAPEEIAGVLAHEMGHGLEKDPEALFLRNIGMKVIVKFTAWAEDSRAAFRAMLCSFAIPAKPRSRRMPMPSPF